MTDPSLVRRGACDLLPEVDVFQVAHGEQSTQLQTHHLIPSHGQLVHSTQSLQHCWDVIEVIEGEAKTAELGQSTQLSGKGAQVVSIQRQRLQATGQEEDLVSVSLSTN